MTSGSIWKAALSAVGCIGVIAGATRQANADSTIKTPGDHPAYAVELEPHAVLGWSGFYGSNGFGLGARVSIPIVDNGFISSINNNVAIGVGLDWVHYSSCYYYDRTNGYGCGANYLLFPVVMQWNFFVHSRWSVFGEPGVVIYHGFFDDYCNARFADCGYPTRTGLNLAFYAGARYHFNEHVSLTMRVGFPTVSVGLSFW